MSALTRLGEALRDLWPFDDPAKETVKWGAALPPPPLKRDPFEEGVTEVALKPVLFANPDILTDPDILKDLNISRFYRDSAKNVAALKESFEEQMPGITGHMHDTELLRITNRIFEHGAHAALINMDEGDWKVDVIAKPGKTEINYFASNASGMSLEYLRRFPGDENTWRKFFGVHEGVHVNQKSPDLPWDTDEKRSIILKNEVEADKAGLAYLRSLGREDMVQAWKDYRALAARHDDVHATSIFLDNDADATAEHMQALKIFVKEMHEAVAREMGVNISDSRKALYEGEKLFRTDPEKYIGIIDYLLAGGEIGSTPEVTAYIKDYAGAYRRQVLEAHLDPAVPPDKKAGEPRRNETCRHIHIHSDTQKSRMEIDGKTAPEYFKQKAMETINILQPENPAPAETGLNPPRPGLR